MWLRVSKSDAQARHAVLSLAGAFGLLLAALVAAAPGAASAQLFRRPCVPCVPCPSTTPEIGPARSRKPARKAPEPRKAPPRRRERRLLRPPRRPVIFSRKRTRGPPAGPKARAPNMIGDFFGSAAATVHASFATSRSQTLDAGLQLHVRWKSVSNLLLVGYRRTTDVVTSGDPWTITISGSPAFQGARSGSVTGYGPGAGIPNARTRREWNDQGDRARLQSWWRTFRGGRLSIPARTSLSTLTSPTRSILPNPGSGGVVGRTKIADDTSPMPQDRILFDYSFFDGVPLAPGGVNVHRFTPGFEKTFFDGMMSFEMKIPAAITMDSTMVQDGGTDLSHGEFGDLALTFKTLLVQWEHLAISGGLTVTAPTARDTNLGLSDGTPLVRIANRATHLGRFWVSSGRPTTRSSSRASTRWMSRPAARRSLSISTGRASIRRGHAARHDLPIHRPGTRLLALSRARAASAA